MKIKDIGYLNMGRASEVQKGTIVLYDDEQNPVLDLYGQTDFQTGEYLMTDRELEILANDVCRVWNAELASEKKSEQRVIIYVKGGTVVDVINQPNNIIIEVRDYDIVDRVDPLEWSYDDINEPYIGEIYD